MKDSLLQHSVDFIFDHFLDITIVVLFIGIYSSFVILNGLIERKSKPKLKRVVVIENLSNQGDTHSDMRSAMHNGFCKSTLHDNNKREENCKKLSQSNCNAVECCVYAKQQGSDIFTCVAGDKFGPTFISKPPVDEYYYLGKLKKGGKKEIKLKN